MRRYGFVVSILFMVSFLAAMSGCVISPRRIVGGSTSPTPTPSGSPTPTPTPNPTVTGKLYVSNQSGNAILRFNNAFAATGNIAPDATIVGTATGLNGPQFMTIDTANDRLFVANANAGTILIWEAVSTRNGNIAPNRVLGGGPVSGITTPSDVALDRVHDLLYVADGPEVFVFSQASTINGDQPPTRDIIFNTVNAQGMLLDTTHDRLYITDGGTNSINVFDSASTLNGVGINPTRTISGASTGLSQPTGITFDAAGNLVVANQGNGSITIYADPGGTATGNINAAPIAKLSGTNTTLLNPGQVIRDTHSTNNDVIVADSAADEVAVFTSVTSQTGNVAPSRKIAGSSTTLTGVSARGLAFDPSR